MQKALWIIIFCVFSSGAYAKEDTGIAQARAFFDKYLSLWKQYEPAVADLYADDAIIRQRHIQKNGDIKENDIFVTKYKETIAKLMPENKKQGGNVYHEGIKVVREGDAYRITATVYSDRQKTKRPFSMLVLQDAAGKWQIKEEIKTYKFD